MARNLARGRLGGQDTARSELSQPRTVIWCGSRPSRGPLSAEHRFSSLMHGFAAEATAGEPLVEEALSTPAVQPMLSTRLSGPILIRLCQYV